MLKKIDLLAPAVLALGLAGATGSATAADLGGACCADLEERIAELEATSARKGNRKVSLTISGAVNYAVVHWDDGGEQNTYIVTNENYRSRFSFKGKAKVSEDLEAGYSIEVGVRTANGKRFTQTDPNSTKASDVGFDVRDSYWFLKSKSLGTLSMGGQAGAANGVSEANQTQTYYFAKYSDVEDMGLGLSLRSSANGGLSALTWHRLIGDGGDQPGDGERALDVVKYETPEFAGFKLSTSWGQDDMWDLALRYTGEANGFKIAAAIGYGEVTDASQSSTVCAAVLENGEHAGADTACQQLAGSVSVLHEASGLFVNAAAGMKTDDLIDHSVAFAGTGVDDEQTFWAVQGGVEKKFTDLGKTTIYGEYFQYDGGGNNHRTLGAADAVNPLAGSEAAIWSTSLESYGAGLAQGIDAAQMILYLSYRHYEAGLTAKALVGGAASGPAASADLEDLDIVTAGGVIRF